MQVHPTLLESQDDHSEQDVGSKDAPLSKEIYLVHYNGFVFGCNFSKIIIIREREAKKENESEDEDSKSLSESDGESDGSKEFRNKKSKVNAAAQNEDKEEEEVVENDNSIIREDSFGY